MLARSLIVAVALTATAFAAPIASPDAAPDASPAIAARDPAPTWFSTNPDTIYDSDGDGVPEYHPINWNTGP